MKIFVHSIVVPIVAVYSFVLSPWLWRIIWSGGHQVCSSFSLCLCGGTSKSLIPLILIWKKSQWFSFLLEDRSFHIVSFFKVYSIVSQCFHRDWSPPTHTHTCMALGTSKERDFVEVFSGRGEISRALRDVTWWADFEHMLAILLSQKKWSDYFQKHNPLYRINPSDLINPKTWESPRLHMWRLVFVAPRLICA